MGEAKNSHFYDFGIWGRVPEPRNQLFLSFETPGHLKQIKHPPLEQFVKNNVSMNLIIPEIHAFSNFRAPENDEDPLNTILKILDTRSRSSRKHGMEMW